MLEQIARRDRITLDLARSRPVEGNPGMQDVPGYVPIVGTFDYPEHGTVEYVPPEEALDPESLASMQGIPFTLDHPEGGQIVTSDNASQLVHGWLLSYAPRGREGVDVWVRLSTTDAVAAVRGGLCQLSYGYDAELDKTPGVDPAGKPYTGVQRRRRYNHLAGVGLARVGGNARLRLDAMRMHKLTHAGRTFTIAALLATSLRAAAAEVPPKPQRTDAMDLGEIVIDGDTLIVPRTVIDAIIAMLSGQAPGAAEPPAVDAAPAPGAPPVDPAVPPRMDSLPTAMVAQLREFVRSEVAAGVTAVTSRIDAESRDRLQVERQAGEILGPTFSYQDADTWAIAAAAVAHEDEARKADADALAAAARKGDLRAQGRLLGHLDSAVERYQDGYSGGGELALAFSNARRAKGRTDAEAEVEGAEDDDENSDAARRRMIDRMHKRDKAPAPRALASGDDK